MCIHIRTYTNMSVYVKTAFTRRSKKTNMIASTPVRSANHLQIMKF